MRNLSMDKLLKVQAEARRKPGEGKPEEQPETRQEPTAETAEITNGHKGEKSSLGLVAKWSGEFGYVSLHDPLTGEWHDIPTKDAPGWALWEARKRKELYKSVAREAYRLTSREMEKIWEAEHPPKEEGIIEEYPIEEEDGA